MTELMKFSFEDTEVRTVEIDGEPWFVAVDVCKILEIANSRDAVARLDDDEKGVALTDTPGGAQEVTIINESGLYTLILGSRKPEAKAFKRWITHDVLPTIRKQGYYSTLPPEQLAVAVLEACNDKWKFENVVIPALQKSNVNQRQLMARYMGLYDYDLFGKRLLRAASDNDRSRRIMQRWEDTGIRYWCQEDFPEEWRESLFAAVSIDEMHKKHRYTEHFAKFCGVTYFDKQGYNLILNRMAREGGIARERFDEWREYAGIA